MSPTPEQILNALIDAINKVKENMLYCQSCPRDKEHFIYMAEDCLDKLSDAVGIFIDAVKSHLNDVETDVSEFTIQGAVELADGRVVAVKDVVGYSYEVELSVGGRSIATVVVEEKVQCEDGRVVARADAYIGDIHDSETKALFCTKYSDSELCDNTGAEGF